ncbi:hypothetical protein CDL12_07185 [Handroanthus impetiginosus]|uniref:S-protein homolog n=1 Tax=Handroanthus impetiginosus TaxID=429701 RepID=A0A2G9HRI1_9LAMI|nr:hypothetical protein CDL12_07185 [Handroanthus impetiginosus]
MHFTTTVCATFLLIAFLLHISITHAKLNANEKIVVVTNNHTNYLSIRCFSFDNDFDVTHLPSWGQYKFRVRKRVVYPSSTIFNCSTNMGTFVAFKYDYECSKDKYDTCDWRFDEESAYRWDPKLNTWVAYDYAPNYESLNRGGVIKGYFAN